MLTFPYTNTVSSHLTELTISLYPLLSSPSLNFLIHPESLFKVFALTLYVNKVHLFTLVDVSLNLNRSLLTILFPIP